MNERQLRLREEVPRPQPGVRIRHERCRTAERANKVRGVRVREGAPSCWAASSFYFDGLRCGFALASGICVRTRALSSCSSLVAYRRVRDLATGGMGRVFSADHARFGRVAIKLGTRDTPAARALLQREARVTAALEHPNVVRVHEIAETRAGVPY